MWYKTQLSISGMLIKQMFLNSTGQFWEWKGVVLSQDNRHKTIIPC